MPRLALRVAAILAGLLFCVPLHYLWKLLGLRSIKKGSPPVPEQAIREAKLTTAAIKS